MVKGDKIYFQEDRWMGDSPLMNKLPRIYVKKEKEKNRGQQQQSQEYGKKISGNGVWNGGEVGLNGKIPY